MVNGGFPAADRYGFEMVHAAWPGFKGERPSSIENLHRIKSIGFFTDSRRFKCVGNICNLSTTVSHEPIARSNRNNIKRNGRGREMFFLLRMAFWLGLVLVLLPRDKTPESEKLPQVNASEAVSAATAAVSDMGQFCRRQPQACEVGGQAATVIGHRAQAGARKLYQILTDQKPPDHTRSDRS